MKSKIEPADKQFFLFDLDGTITDSKQGIIKSLQYSLSFFGINVEESDVLPFIGPPLIDSFTHFCGFDENASKKAISKYREYFSEQGIFENALYPGIDSLLQTLYQKGKTLAVATSKAEFYADRIIKHFGLNDYFTFVAGSEMDGRRSKKSEVIRYALDNLETPKFDRVIMTGDREHDITGAKQTGIDSVGVLYGYGSLDELNKAGADYICENMNKLQDLLC